ncbi:3820_t:CDS:2 [Cetraspora pellucida]|uniref:3820_t:CDS:1 n=1 Tax=Cetraspora pellucida TaxID=1433469 RepID=A0A9N8WSP1_9GLOM|nr:3820_t:CDS:2 [Cetraspora pellucida]
MQLSGKSDGKSSKLGGSAFSFNEIYERLKEFSQNLTKNKYARSRLYFAKMDVQYDFPNFPTFARESAQKIPNSVFIDRVKESYLDRENILDLLEKHIKYNLIKSLFVITK